MATPLELPLQQIRSNFLGFSRLVNLSMSLDQLEYTPISINMSSANWIDANMCAPLGAILTRASRHLNMIKFTNIRADVKTILQKNGFLSYYGGEKIEDLFSSTIRYQRFEPKDDRHFGDYIEQQFRNKAIPDMSSALRKKFWESIFELFSNAVIHSKTKLGIFTCGQYFHQRKHIDFAIADLGIGISQTLIDNKGLHLHPVNAIDWAMEGTNTTKTGSIPGGLGLKLLRDFIRINAGRIQVVSDVGYWEQHADGSVEKQILPNPFPGTIVNIEINTADTNSYILSSEVSQDIF